MLHPKPSARKRSRNERDTSGTPAIGNFFAPAAPNGAPTGHGRGGGGPPRRSRMDLAEEALRELFGHAGFRPGQAEVVELTLSKQDVFFVSGTGSGKSLTFQLPAVLSPGVTLVVSPLLSLIEDQVTALITLQPAGGIPAAHLTSATPAAVRRQIRADLQAEVPTLKLLYVTPENCVNGSELMQQLRRLHKDGLLARLVVDEAHCVTAWGHDFRPDYARLGVLKKQFPDVPLIALTATVTKQALDDAKKALGVQHCVVKRRTSDRPNLFFRVINMSDQPPSDVFDAVKSFVTDPHTAAQGGRACGICYTMTKKDAEKLAFELTCQGVAAHHYHAGQSSTERRAVQTCWQTGEVRVVCATIAYGMGIDKADVRFVIHASLAKSLCAYLQEAGRAGRDGQPSECVCFFRSQDVSKLSRIISMPKKGGGRGRGARGSTARDQERLEEMADYCRAHQCRRKLLLQHFGEQSVPHDRRRGGPPCCDFCSHRPSALVMRPPQKQRRTDVSTPRFATASELAKAQAAEVEEVMSD